MAKRNGRGNSKTPMMAQYTAIKREHPDALLFYRMGDFYEMFGEDAREAAALLNITLTARSKGDNAIPMAGVPVRAAHNYLVKLIRAGKRVAVCEQMQDPRDTKGLLERQVVRIVTAGTLTEEEVLEDSEPNYRVAWLDVSTGEFQLTECATARLNDELARIDPAELLLPEDMDIALPSVRGPVQRRPDFDFHAGEAEKELTRFFGVQSLAGFGVDAIEVPAGLACAGALIRYAEETQKSALPHVRRIECFQRSSRMALDQATRSSLELVRTQREGQKDGSLLSIIDETLTPMGARLLRERVLAPFLDRERIERVQDAVSESVEAPALRDALRDCLTGIRDLERLAGRLSCGRANARDLVSLAAGMRVLPELRTAVQGAQSTLLMAVRDELDDLADLADRIQQRIVDEPPLALKEGGVIREGFDADLDELRTIGREGKVWMARFQARAIEESGIATLRVAFNKVFGYYVEVPRSAGTETIPASWIRKQTVKHAERYVTPELKDYETKVLKSDELACDQEFELFVALRDELASQVSRILDAARHVAEVDVAAALAELAVKRAWCRPALSNGQELTIEDGRHPVIETMLAGEPFVPNDCALGPPARSLIVLTGPNMAGKSTWIRQVALIVLLAQIGSWVPARSASVGLVDRIFTRVGAADDIARGSSTFMVEMEETANILNNATDRSLVILDEVGRGTSTYDGLALAWAICEALHDRIGCRTLFATHYHQITELADLAVGVHNAHVAVREWEEDIVFLHRIEAGGTDKSYGLHVARLAGIPGDILDRAHSVLTKLEGEGERTKPALATKRHDGQQLDLFQPPPSPACDELSELDPDKLSPLEALLKLKELKERYGS